jgi:hypothetical protein
MTSEHLIRLIARLYPAAYRAEHGEEVLSTVRDSLSSSRRGTAALELADLAAHALRERVRFTATSRSGAVAATAAPLAAGSAIALSLVFLVFAETPWAPERGFDWNVWHRFGPFATLGPLAYLAWLLVFVAVLAGRGGTARLLTAMAMALSAAIVPLSHLTKIQRPPAYMLVALALFGLIVLAAPSDPIRRAMDRRVLTAWTVLLTGFLSGISLEYGLPQTQPALGDTRPLWYMGRDSIVAMGDLLPWALALLLVVSVLCLRLNRRLPLAAVAVTLPWAVFVHGISGRPSPVLVALVCAAGLAGLIPPLSLLDTRDRTDRRVVLPDGDPD